MPYLVYKGRTGGALQVSTNVNVDGERVELRLREDGFGNMCLNFTDHPHAEFIEAWFKQDVFADGWQVAEELSLDGDVGDRYLALSIEDVEIKVAQIQDKSILEKLYASLYRAGAMQQSAMVAARLKVLQELDAGYAKVQADIKKDREKAKKQAAKEKEAVESEAVAAEDPAEAADSDPLESARELLNTEGVDLYLTDANNLSKKKLENELGFELTEKHFAILKKEYAAE